MTEHSFQAGVEALRDLLLEDGDKNNGSSLCVESGYWSNARRYLSSLTPAPPTPNQGILERARAVLAETIRHACVDPDSDEAQFRMLEPFLETNIAAALTAAASEARAAAIEAAYNDAEQAAVNPMLCEDGDGPLDLQRKIGQAIQFRKRLAFATPAPEGK